MIQAHQSRHWMSWVTPFGISVAANTRATTAKNAAVKRDIQGAVVREAPTIVVQTRKTATRKASSTSAWHPSTKVWRNENGLHRTNLRRIARRRLRRPWASAFSDPRRRHVHHSCKE